MGTMCYNPDSFTPNNQALLSKAQWQQVQFYLNNCMQLPLKVGNDPSKGEFPYADSVAVYKTIHSSAAAFQTGTLPDASAMANALYNYGQTSVATFGAVAQLIQQGSADRVVLQKLFSNLKSETAGYQAAAKKIFTETEVFANTIGTAKGDLTAITKKYVDQSGGLKSQIEALKIDVQTQQSIITEAQTKILGDKKVIKDTVYYSWIPLVGTIIALVEIITHEKDIQEQLKKIKAAVTQIQTDNSKIATDEANMAQLIYAETFNNKQVDLIAGVLPNIQKIEGAWGTISQELGDVMGNIDKASDPSQIPCLKNIALTTATNEWQTVANDAHDFMLNFYVQPEASMTKAA
ncbi:hypothetical protein [Pseudooctadecabacter sp.]|uniref:hypothetical protein n=1 Tax=Pseudooctadecabacter sp. TaxID=1966338 RepID=UPI0035C80C20